MAGLLAERPEADTLQKVLKRLHRYRKHYPLWARTFIRIRTKDEKIARFVLKKIQLQIGEVEAKLLKKHGMARYFVLKGRQGGVSTDQQIRALHMIWHRPYSMAMTLAHTGEDTEKLFRITQTAVELFPEGWLPELGPKETHEVTFKNLRSTFWTGTAGSKRTGRGLTLSRVHGSEFAFWDDPKLIMNQLGRALEGVLGSVICLETTASGHGSPAHEFWEAAVKGKNGYTPVFIPWWDCDPPRYRVPLLDRGELGRLEDDEKMLVEKYGLDHEQLKWRRKLMLEMGRPEFLQEYPEDSESCWLAPGGMYYEAELLTELMKRAPEPRKNLLNGKLQLFDELPEGERAIIGADVAEGVGGDSSVFTARSFPSNRLLARYADNRIPPDEFGIILNDWGRKFRGALIVPEKNAHGITVIRTLRDKCGYPVGSIYHRTPLDKELQEQQSDSERLGWVTSGETYPLLLNAGRQLLNAAKNGTAGVPSKAALADAFKVRRDKNGQIKLNGLDTIVSEMLAFLGRDQPPHRWEAA